MMKYFLLIFFLCGSVCLGGEPSVEKCVDGKCLLKSSTDSPLVVAVQDVASSATSLQSKVSERDKLLAQLSVLNADIGTLRTALVSSRGTLNKILDDLSDPNPKPVPVAHVVQLVEIASSTCPPCNAFQPTFDLMAKTMNMKRIDCDKVKSPFAPFNSTPSWVITMDGAEVSRVEGYLGKEKLVEWYNSVVVWAKTQK